MKVTQELFSLEQYPVLSSRIHLLSLKISNAATLNSLQEDIIDIGANYIAPIMDKINPRAATRVNIYRSNHLELFVADRIGYERIILPHDHGELAEGWVYVIAGRVQNHVYNRESLKEISAEIHHSGSSFLIPRGILHADSNPVNERSITLNFFTPAVSRLKVYDFAERKVYRIRDEARPVIPEPQDILEILPLQPLEASC